MSQLILETSIGLVNVNYSGGNYIEIGYGENAPSDLINISNYITGSYTIDPTPENIQSKVIEWLQEEETNLEIYSIKITY